MKNLVSVSCTNSGLNVYLSQAAADVLGTEVCQLKYEKMADESAVVSIIVGYGNNRLSKHNNPTYPYRISARQLNSDGMRFPDIEKFGTTVLPFEPIDASTRRRGITMKLPPLSQLDSPRIMTRSKTATGGVRVTMLEQTAMQRFAHHLKHVNELLVSGELDDSLQLFRYNTVAAEGTEPLTQLPSIGTWKLVGKIIREETLE